MSDRRQNLVGKRYGRGIVVRYLGQIPRCKRCNQAKNSTSYEEFMSWVARIYSHSCILQQAEVHHVS